MNVDLTNGHIVGVYSKQALWVISGHCVTFVRVVVRKWTKETTRWQ